MQNLFDPAILFFVFGCFAGLIRSNLEIPRSIAKFLSLYLLMALGLKGGFALAKTGLNTEIAFSLLVALAMAFIVPVLGYWFLKERIAKFDAAAIAASYGSVSAVTFVTAIQYMEQSQLNPNAYMAIALVIMESPAIIMAVLLANMLRHQSQSTQGTQGLSLKGILHESFTDGAHLLLLGSMAVGYFSGEAGRTVMQPFSGDLFKGMLAFFLLDMGLMVANNFKEARSNSLTLIGYASISPFVHASLALGLCLLFEISLADTILLMVLSASASYIVVPAVLRYAIPEANPSIYFGLSIGITFPINILIGIPFYAWLAQSLGG
ncbi:sodium-dependent bicarbonate transport family permease [Polynucleobacter acidiphobus]|uniref:sodium-dependent bicarbonate transport family permease n=1 Tax=Polynucleobacter acidiphobus TaxID=556053 RepID=UPI000D36F035|nr:sodium-dependent bicarbonate transport family permease [Polynucleobacter acidiphobus]